MGRPDGTGRNATRAYLRHGPRSIELEDALVIGRSSSCDLPIGDRLASRRHCRVEWAGELIRVTDLDSKNGVRVNGRPVEGSTEVHHGDVITVGEQQLVLLRHAIVDVRPRPSQARTRPEGPGRRSADPR